MLRFYVLCRWARLTFRRYGVLSLAFGHTSRHAGVGRGSGRDTVWARAHGAATGYQLRALDLVRALQLERAIV
jgi:hypothetical protein